MERTRANEHDGRRLFAYAGQMQPADLFDTSAIILRRFLADSSIFPKLGRLFATFKLRRIRAVSVILFSGFIFASVDGVRSRLALEVNK